MLSVLLMLVGVLLLLLPGVVAWRRMFPENAAEECTALGSALGLAVAVYLAYVTAIVSITWFWPIWLVLCVGTLLIGRFSKWKEFRPSATVVLILALVAASQFFVVSLHRLPGGWDPSFHCLLAKKILLTGRLISDWTPFAPATLNDPLGSHLLLVQLSRISRLPIHTVFKLLMPALSVLSTLAVFALTLRTFGSKNAALYSAIAYGLWVFGGNVDYLRWGGLPNQLAMIFAIAIVSLIVRCSEGKHSAILIGVFFAAICLTHHHVMIACGAMLAALFLYFWITKDSRRWTILQSFAISFVIAVFFLVPYAAKALNLKHTDVLRFYEPPIGLHTLADSGPVALVIGIVGAILAFRSRRRTSPESVLSVCCGTLLLLYIVCDPIYRLISILRFHESFVAFTPSRFLNDLSYLLAVFAGYALYRLQQQTSRPTRQIIVVALALALLNVPQWMVLRENRMPEGRWQAYEWIGANTPDDSFIATAEAWAPYATWRRTLKAPLPVSEPTPVSNTPQEAKDIFAVNDPYRHPQGIVVWKNADGWTVSKLTTP
jgi:hypothetical protein